MRKRIMGVLIAAGVSFSVVYPISAQMANQPVVVKADKQPEKTKKKVIKKEEKKEENIEEVSVEPQVQENPQPAQYVEPVMQEPVVQEPVYQPEPTPPANTGGTYSPNDLMVMGVLYWGGYRWTWYSERVLPGGGLNIPGRHGDENGFICDGEGYICLASSDLPKGTVISTPFGKAGRVYDSGCASGTLDVYVNW